jgi:hypothetical protein
VRRNTSNEPAAPLNQNRDTPPQRMGVPAYAYPPTNMAYWSQLLTGAPTLGLIVADPADGPGIRRDPNYVAAIEQAHERGIAVVGYVTLRYGASAGAPLAAAIESWYALYAVDGIFVDEVPSSKLCVVDCERVYRWVKSQLSGLGLVVLNPGTQTVEDYMAACDILVNNESTWLTYRDAYPPPPAWVDDYPAERFWHLVHACPTESEMRAALWLARDRNAGWIFVTDHTGVNAYDTLPREDYWTSELRRVDGTGDPRPSRADDPPPPDH